MRDNKVILIFLLMSAMVIYQTALSERAEADGDEEKTYVGTVSCGKCHEDHYSSYTANSKKAHSFESVRKMRKGLTDSEYEECLTCHTTGYGKPGGYQSEQATPELKNLGCESCHGPGSAHIESEDPEDIISSLNVEFCTSCHNPERVDAFNFKPLLFGGAH
jgi:hypothetical protein